MSAQKPLPGSSHKYLEENIERNKELLSPKMGESPKDKMKRMSTMRPGSRFPNREKSASMSKEQLVKTAYWEGFSKLARAQGLSNQDVLGACVTHDKLGKGTGNNIYIYKALQKIAMEDMEGCSEALEGPSPMQDSDLKEDQEANELAFDEGFQESLEGSPMQNPDLKADIEEGECENDQETQEPSIPVEGPSVDLKEASFRQGFNDTLAKNAQLGLQGALSYGALGAGLGGLAGAGVGYLTAPEEAEARRQHYLKYILGGAGVGGLALGGAALGAAGGIAGSHAQDTSDKVDRILGSMTDVVQRGGKALDRAQVAADAAAQELR